MKPTRIVFDLGAVLFSWQPRRMLMRELPHAVPDETTAAHWEAQVFQGYSGDWGEFDRGTVAVPELVQRIAQRTGFAAADVQTVVDAVPRELQPIPESVTLLHRLADAGHTLHYLSNMPAPYAEILERQPFFARFASGVFSGRVHHNKPEPEIFRAAVQRFGAPPQQLLFIDDHLPNVQAAQALGWQAFQFLHAGDASLKLQDMGLLEASGSASVASV